VQKPFGIIPVGVPIGELLLPEEPLRKKFLEIFGGTHPVVEISF